MKIIRTRQRPFLVVLDAFFTLLAWVGLSYLLVRGLWPLLNTHTGPRIEVSVLDALGTLQLYVWVALLNAVLLIAWARYQQHRSKGFARRRKAAPVVGDHGLQASFRLSNELLMQLRRPGVMVIHNDEAGDISQVVTGYLRLDQCNYQ